MDNEKPDAKKKKADSLVETLLKGKSLTVPATKAITDVIESASEDKDDRPCSG